MGSGSKKVAIKKCKCGRMDMQRYVNNDIGFKFILGETGKNTLWVHFDITCDYCSKCGRWALSRRDSKLGLVPAGEGQLKP